jgi:hypothetical protein
MEGVAGKLLSALRSFAPLFDRLSMRQCLVAIEILERLFQYAYTEDADGSQLVVAEIRIVLLQYVSHYAEGKAVPKGRARAVARTKK